MEKILLGEVYIIRYGEKIHWKSMSPEKQECVKRAVALYICRAGKKSKMYKICADLLFRIARFERITGRVQNTLLQ